MKPISRLLSAWLACSVLSASLAADKPHVVFLFTDDQRADTIGALGHPHVQTPNLDALARRGMVFRNAYCLGGNSPAVCLPSRNMLLSGRAYFRWQGPQAPASDATFPAVMKAAGYETYHHGKRGNTALNIQAQFDHNLYLQDQEDRTSGEPGQVIVDRAIEFLKSRDQAQAGVHVPRVCESSRPARGR